MNIATEIREPLLEPRTVKNYLTEGHTLRSWMLTTSGERGSRRIALTSGRPSRSTVSVTETARQRNGSVILRSNRSVRRCAAPRTRTAIQRGPSRRRRAATAAGTSPVTSPPNPATSLTRLDDTNDHLALVGTSRVSTPDSERFICAIGSS